MTFVLMVIEFMQYEGIQGKLWSRNTGVLSAVFAAGSKCRMEAELGSVLEGKTC